MSDNSIMLKMAAFKKIKKTIFSIPKFFSNSLLALKKTKKPQKNK